MLFSIEEFCDPCTKPFTRGLNKKTRSEERVLITRAFTLGSDGIYRIATQRWVTYVIYQLLDLFLRSWGHQAH